MNPGNAIFPEHAPVVFGSLSPVAVNNADVAKTISPAAEVVAAAEPVPLSDTKYGLST